MGEGSQAQRSQYSKKDHLVSVRDRDRADGFLTSSIPVYGDNYDDDDDSTMSNGSSFSLETTDDAISSPQHSSSSSTVSSESLYDFSVLMDQLPIKRGLSMFYQGKSESFRSLSKVSSLDDLKKKETPYTDTSYRTKKANHKSGSYRAGFDKYKSFNLPKPTTRFKKTPRASFSSSFSSKRVSFVCRHKTPPPEITSLKD